jgi:hypothetical protein
MSDVGPNLSAPLSGLPGSGTDPGTGPLAEPLFEYLLDDAVLLGPALLAARTAAADDDADPANTGAMADAVQGHRDRLRGEYAHLMGPLLVPADQVEAFAAALTAGDDALRVLLVCPDASDVRIGVPPGPPAMMTAALLTLLDFTVPAWIEVTAGTDASEVLRGVATDGAEEITLVATGRDDDLALAGLIRMVLDDDQTFRVTPGALTGDGPKPDDGGSQGRALVRSYGRHGLLNLLAAVHAGIHGAGVADLAQILACRDPAPLLSGLRGLSRTDAAVTRAHIVSVEVADVATAQAQLLELGLLHPQD